MLLSGRDGRQDSLSAWHHRASLLACLLIGLLCGWQFSDRGCRVELTRGAYEGARSPVPGVDPAARAQGNLVRLPAPLRSLSLTHLVMVAGHGVHLGVDFATLRTNDEAWSLKPYQRNNGQTDAFVKHIERAVQIAAEDPQSLLVFSGGETRVTAGPLNIASTNWMIAERLHWFGFPSVRARSTTEPLSRDSYENLLWSICRFDEMTGAYPSRVTVVGFEFKRFRFEAMHRAAIRFPADALIYVGIDHPDPSAALKGELAKSITPFRSDPYGCGAEMIAKKNERNPFARGMFGWVQTCPHLAELMLFCGPEQFAGPLPWD